MIAAGQTLLDRALNRGERPGDQRQSESPFAQLNPGELIFGPRGKSGGDLCLNVAKDKGRDLCAIDIDRNLPADPRAIALRCGATPG